MDLSRLQQLVKSEEIRISHQVVSQENQNRFFFFFMFFTVWPDTGIEEVCKQTRSVNQAAYSRQSFLTEKLVY